MILSRLSRIVAIGQILSGCIRITHILEIYGHLKLIVNPTPSSLSKGYGQTSEYYKTIYMHIPLQYGYLSAVRYRRWACLEKEGCYLARMAPISFCVRKLSTCFHPLKPKTTFSSGSQSGPPNRYLLRGRTIRVQVFATLQSIRPGSSIPKWRAIGFYSLKRQTVNSERELGDTTTYMRGEKYRRLFSPLIRQSGVETLQSPLNAPMFLQPQNQTANQALGGIWSQKPIDYPVGDQKRLISLLSTVIRHRHITTVIARAQFYTIINQKTYQLHYAEAN